MLIAGPPPPWWYGAAASFVVAALRGLGAHVIEADERHQVIDPAARLKIAQRIWRLTGANWCGGRNQRAVLNSIVHPAVRTRAKRLISEISARDARAVIVYVAAILIESGRGLKAQPEDNCLLRARAAD